MEKYFAKVPKANKEMQHNRTQFINSKPKKQDIELPKTVKSIADLLPEELASILSYLEIEVQKKIKLTK